MPAFMAVVVVICPPSPSSTEVELSMDSSYPTTLSDCMVSVKERVTLVPSSSRA